MNIPEEFLMDEEMKLLYEQCDELREVFQQEHKELEALKKDVPDYDEIVKETIEIEKERD